jgi:predicted dehydrogenase
MHAMNSIRWAVLGPGRIAHQFAEAVQGLPGAQLSAVWARRPAQAFEFAQAWAQDGKAPQLFDDLPSLLASPLVDAVYIATPHAQHGDLVRAALLARKPVLCEKPLVPNHAQGLALTTLAQQQGVFLMEALWTRFLPLYDRVGGWLRGHRIGALRGVQSNFCFAAPMGEQFDAQSRLFNPALAGGALLDIGVYNLSMTRWVLQQAWGACPEPSALHVQGRMAPTGVDQSVAASLVFDIASAKRSSNDAMLQITAQMFCAFDAQADNLLRIQGESGHIEIGPNFWQATRAVLHRHGHLAEQVDAPLRINGFEGQIEEAMRCICAGATQSAVMPHAETLATLAWMDRMRAALGVRYPFE